MTLVIGMDYFGRAATKLVIFGALAGGLAPLMAAEVRGTVVVDYRGLFAAGSSGQPHPVSVALIPAAGQRVKKRRPQQQHIEIVENRLHPAFLTAQKGDTVEFVNRDSVYHEIFTLSSGKHLSAQVAKADQGADSKAVFRLERAGATHFFCRIHKKSYARIDVVETPYLKTVDAGRAFSFSGLAPGEWTLRLASPAAETRWVPVTAVTAPPPLKLTLVSRDGGHGSAAFRTVAGVEELYRNQSGKDASQ